MEPLKYRFMIWIIAIIDIILSSMYLGWGLLIVGIVLFYSKTFEDVYGTNENKLEAMPCLGPVKPADDPVNNYKISFSSAVVLLLICACLLQIVAAIKLLNSSIPDKAPREALILCRFWRRITVPFTIFLCINVFLDSQERLPWFERLFIATSIIMRFIFVYYVQKFIRELQSASDFRIGIPPTLNMDSEALNPPPYFPAACSYPPTDMTAPPPPYEECVKQPIKNVIKE